MRLNPHAGGRKETASVSAENTQQKTGREGRARPELRKQKG
jgi:hypothetical protein